MNILGVGGWEIAVIFVIALIFAGPKRMMQWAFIAGKYMGQLRVMWRNMMKTIQKEFDEAGVDIQLPKDIPTRQDVGRLAGQALAPFSEPMKQAMDEVQQETNVLQEVASELQVNGNNAQSQVDENTGNLGTWSANTSEGDSNTDQSN